MLIKYSENPSYFFIILAVLVIKRVQRVLHKLHATRAIIRTLTVTYGTLQKNKRSSVLNLPKQRQVCPSLFFQFNMRISVIYGTLSVSCKRVVSVLSPLASNSCGGSVKIIHQCLQNIVVQPLISINNLSLSTGVFPESRSKSLK